MAHQHPEHRHVVQLYRDQAFLRRAVVDWIAPPLLHGGGAVLVCTPANADAVRDELRARSLDPAPLESAGRLAFVDAEGLMSRFMVEGLPDAGAFLRLAGALVRSVREACGSSPGEIRAWGEMVNLLFHGGDVPAAQSLERLWNEAIAREDIRLLCSYRVDNLDPRTHEGVLQDICEGHSQLLPEDHEARFERALSQAMREVLGSAQAAAIWDLHATRPPVSIQMPPAEAVLVALHATDPAGSRAVLERTRAFLHA